MQLNLLGFGWAKFDHAGMPRLCPTTFWEDLTPEYLFSKTFSFAFSAQCTGGRQPEQFPMARRSFWFYISILLWFTQKLCWPWLL